MRPDLSAVPCACGHLVEACTCPPGTHPAPTLQQVLDALVEESRGDAYPGVVGNQLLLECVPGSIVYVYVDTWSYYGTIWNAHLELAEQDFRVPLLEGPHIDEHQPLEDAIPEVVEWLRKVTDSHPSRDERE